MIFSRSAEAIVDNDCCKVEKDARDFVGVWLETSILPTHDGIEDEASIGFGARLDDLWSDAASVRRTCLSHIWRLGVVEPVHALVLRLQ